jgi:hypothetical protein
MFAKHSQHGIIARAILASVNHGVEGILLSIMNAALSAPKRKNPPEKLIGGDMTVLDIIDRAFHLYRQNFVAFLAVAAVVTVPVALLSLPATILQVRQPFADVTALVQLATGIVTIVASIAQAIIIQTMLTYMASEMHLGNKISLGEAWNGARGRFGTVALGLLLYSIIFGVGAVVSYLLTLCIVGIIGFVLLAYAGASIGYFLFPIMTLENVRPMLALNRAWYLGKQRFWRGLGLYTLLTLITLIVFLSFALVIQLLLLPLSSAGYEEVSLAAQSLMQTLLSLFSVPLNVIAITVFYYDTRVRLEGLDVSYYLSSKAIPRPSNVPSPKPDGRFITGKDTINLLLIFGGIAALFAFIAGIIFIIGQMLGL